MAEGARKLQKEAEKFGLKKKPSGYVAPFGNWFQPTWVEQEDSQKECRSGYVQIK